jgi:hypothetical protein
MYGYVRVRGGPKPYNPPFCLAVEEKHKARILSIYPEKKSGFRR